MLNEYPKAIVHVDGDAFFVGCELASKPWFKGRPVVTGEERGIVSALSYEAKAQGIRRGMRMSDVRKMCKGVIVISSDFHIYRLYAQRMCKIVSRFSSKVEEYSIDECFADITGMDTVFKMSYEEIARKIKYDLDSELGMTFSVGLSVNKLLAKTASKFQKPSGLTFIPLSQIKNYLSKVPVGTLWGIGGSTAVALGNHKICSALDLASKSPLWLKEFFSKPLQEIYQELNGAFLGEVEKVDRDDFKSVMRTRTFRPPSKDKAVLLRELSQNIEEACARLREGGVLTKEFSFFLKTQNFFYHRMQIHLNQPTSLPTEILKEVEKNFDKIFEPRTLYRATGIRFGSLIPETIISNDLFGESKKSLKISELYKYVDKLDRKYGQETIILASSMRQSKIISKFSKRLNIPFLGEVR